MPRTNIQTRHCQCRKKCTTGTGARRCTATCDHTNRYQVRVRNPNKLNKRGRPTQEARWFETYADAETYLIRRQAELVTGSVVDSRTFREVSEDWLAYTANDTVTSTVEGYERIVRNHLTPVFGDRPVNDITQKEVQAVVNGWNVDHAPQTVRNRVNVLLPILRHGGNEITVGKRNGGVSLPKQKDASNDPTIRQRRYLEDAAELKMLTDAMPERYRLFTTFLAVVGTRPGEALELRQSDIINGQRLEVSRAVKRVAKTVEPSGYKVGDTKTHKSRIVWCPPSLLDQLRDDRAPADSLLFGEDGEWMDYNRYSKAFRKARKALPVRLSKLRVYDLRHTCASVLVNRGASILIVAQQLGHSDASVTAKVYSHLFPSTVDSLMGRVDEDVAVVLGQ